MNDKTKNIKEVFMNEALIDVWNYYSKGLVDKDIEKWDWIVLTASNEEQAKIYENEINYRLKQKVLPIETNYLVVSDPDGKRVGSGGATLNVLSEIRKRDKREFSDLKILTIHSGGDSKRVPQYSACGKLFSPVQRELPDGRSSSLFDEFIITFSSIPSRMSSGMVLLSGDVMLSFNPLQVELFHVDSAAISIKEKAEIAKEHGVFLSDEKGYLLEFLHKQSVKTLKEKGATNSSGNVDIDTGSIYLNSKICDTLYSLISENGITSRNLFDKYINEEVRLSLYGDFLYPLSKNVSLDDYLVQDAEGNINDELLLARKILWNKLSKYEMKVIKTSPSVFIHFGTTKELMNLVSKGIEDYHYLDWKKNILSNASDDCSYSVNSSYIDKSSKLSESCYIEKSYIGEKCNVGKNVILSNIVLEKVNVPPNVCLNTLIEQDDTYVTRIYSIDDNPKTIKSNNSKFLNNNIENVLNFYNISDDQIWESNEKSIWDAKLYKVCKSEKESVESALMLYDIFNMNVSSKSAFDYFNSSRVSLKESFNNCDAIKMKEKAKSIEIYVRTVKFIEKLKNNINLKEASETLIKSPNLLEQINNLVKVVTNEKDYIIYRSYLAISDILKNNKIKDLDYGYFEDLCYKQIKNSIKPLNLKKQDFYDTKKNVNVELPIRVNFAGGWSDTPPYCLENGGSVLNGAFKLNGFNPIKVSVYKLEEPIITLKSIDLGVEETFKDINDLKNCFNTNDAFSLLKASLIISGIVRENDTSIKQIIDRIGGGLKFTTDVASIPKGSGLGTSSILAAACLKALYEFLNIEVDYETIASKVLDQEQLMGTGGGWQDQIGGLVPGIKLITTEPGLCQKFNIDNIILTEKMKDMFNNRYVLIFTGQRRLAKNLLRSIMNSYIRGDEIVVEIIKNIKDISKWMMSSILNSQINEFIDLLNKHWELSKKLDKGCTNSCIDQILNSCEDLIDAKMICGAGGGGFLQVLLKENITKEQLRERINNVFQDSGIKVYDISLVEE